MKNLVSVPAAHREQTCPPETERLVRPALASGGRRRVLGWLAGVPAAKTVAAQDG